MAHQSQPRCFYSWAQRWPCHLHPLVYPPTSLCPALCAEAEVISKKKKNKCRKWHHKMKVSCRIYPATSRKGLRDVFYLLVEHNSTKPAPWQPIVRKHRSTALCPHFKNNLPSAILGKILWVYMLELGTTERPWRHTHSSLYIPWQPALMTNDAWWLS